MKQTANGIDINYQVEGRGPWVTLSHSLSTDLTLWDDLAAALAPDFTVLRYDTRGHGGTGAPAEPYSFAQLTADLAGLLDALQVGRTHFVGLSMGGMIGQHFALAHPQRLERLVIASSTSRVPPEAGAVWEERIAMARKDGCAALVEGTLGRWFTPPYRAAHPEVMARIGRLFAIERDIKERLEFMAGQQGHPIVGTAADAVRLQIRQERTVPELTALRHFLDAQKKDALPKSPWGQAVNYALNQ